MSELVRVKDKTTGHEHNLAADVAKGLPDDVTVLDKPTHNPDGTEIPPKYKQTVAERAAANKAARATPTTSVTSHADEKANPAN